MCMVNVSVCVVVRLQQSEGVILKRPFTVEDSMCVCVCVCVC